MNDVSHNKRRKISSSTNTSIIDLSSDELVAIAQYLPKTSRALFAVALTAPSSSFRERGWECEPSVASKAVVGSIQACDPSALLLSQLVTGLLNERLSQIVNAFGGIRELWSDKRKQLYMKCRRQNCLNEFVKELNGGMTEQLINYYKGGLSTLDFVDLDKSVVSKLTDDDLGAVLVCIEAATHLKRLNLTYCTNHWAWFSATSFLGCTDQVGFDC